MGLLQSVLSAGGWCAGSRPSFYSHHGAPGVVLAVGNSGETLDLAADDVCTWLSTDAGLTWQDVADQPNIYEVGDQGKPLTASNPATLTARYGKSAIHGSYATARL